MGIQFKILKCVTQQKPEGAIVSSTDQTQQVPFMFFIIIHYFERPASSVHLVKAIHLRVRFNLDVNGVKNSYKRYKSVVL